MSFHEVRFPTDLSFGSVGGPERRTDIVALTSGFEERNTPWAHSRRRYDAGLGLRSLDDLAELIAFFEARQGQLYGFRWKDWADFKSCTPSAVPSSSDQLIGTGDGARNGFRLSKTYASGGASYVRPVAKPVAGSVLVEVDGIPLTEGAGFVVETETGIVTLQSAPEVGQEVRAGFVFDVPVRFDTDRIHVSAGAFNAGQIPDIPVVEVRV
ncbi:phage distal tail protein, Rcc01695 family [Mameliella sp.]|uniref:phage distal tail protein, Rcc01695 family n=1 Tax=Mameliella sp. TaxID=1924940 RepID=UPI003BA93C34